MTLQAWILLTALIITLIGCCGIDHQNNKLTEQNSRLTEENKQLKRALMELGEGI